MLTARPWKLETVPYLLVGLCACLCFGAAAVSAVGMMNLALTQMQMQFLLQVVNAIFFQGVLLVIMLVFLRANRLGPVAAFGLRNGQPARLFLIATGLAIPVVPVCWTLGTLSSLLITNAGGQVESQAAVQFLQAEPPLSYKIFLGFTTLGLAPMVEEMLFRGILYSTIKQAGFPRVALYGTAFLFAVFHTNLMAFVPLFLLAIVLTLVYEATDNLFTAILLHGWFNAINYIVLVTGWDMVQWFKSLF